MQVVRAVLGRTGACITAGGIAGLAVGLAASRLLAAVVSHASPRDPVVAGAVVLLLGVVALAGTLTPARRAVAVDPLVALKCD